MINKIIFYNHFQHGDLALSRGIVNWIVQAFNSMMFNYPIDYKIPQHLQLATEIVFGEQDIYLIKKFNFYYLMSRNPNSVFFDHRIKNANSPSEAGLNAGASVDLSNKGELYINTSIGSSPTYMNRIDGEGNPISKPIDFILDFSFLHCIEIIDRIKQITQIELPYPNKKIDILPRSNNNPPQKSKVDQLIYKLKNFSKKILICNGTVMSNQTPNFCIRSLIMSFVRDNPQIAFIYTSKRNDLMDNEFIIDEYCDVPNLNEIDYFSTFCDAIITRRSGPGEMIQTYENFFDSSKTIISLYNWKDGAFYFSEGSAKLKWTNNYTSDSIISLLADI